MDSKEIKKTIKQLKKLKKDCPVKTQHRRDINKKLREFKDRLANIYQIDDEKQKLIDEIYRLKPYLKQIRGIDLCKFTKEELKKHIERVKKGGREWKILQW